MDNFDNNETNTQEDNTSYFSESNENPALEKRKKPKGLIIGICAAALCIVVLAVCVFMLPGISNTFSLAFSTPAKYYEKVEKNYLKKGSEKLADGYDSLKSTYKKNATDGVSQSNKIKLTFDPALSSLSGIPELKDIEADILSSVKEKKAKYEMEFKYGGQNLGTIRSLSDLEKMVSYIQIPELNKGYIKMTPSSINSSLQNKNKYANSVQKFLTGDILSPTDLKQILLRYSNILSKTHGDVKLTKNFDLTINGKKEKYTKVTISYTEKDAHALAKNILTEAKKDSQLKKLIVDLESCKESEYDAKLDKMLKDIENDKALESGNDSMTMDVFVDKDGNISGRSFSFKENSNTFDFGFYTAGKKSNKNFTLWFSIGEHKLLELNGNAMPDKSGVKGKLKATITPTASSLPLSFEVEYSGLKRSVKQNNILLAGKFTLTSPSLSGLSATLEFKPDGEKKQNMELSVSMSDKKLLTMSVISGVEDYKDFDLPGATEKIYDIQSDLEQYQNDSDIEGFLSNIKSITGMTKLGDL